MDRRTRTNAARKYLGSTCRKDSQPGVGNGVLRLSHQLLRARSASQPGSRHAIARRGPRLEQSKQCAHSDLVAARAKSVTLSAARLHCCRRPDATNSPPGSIVTVLM